MFLQFGFRIAYFYKVRRKQLASIVLSRLAEVIPVPETELHYQNPFQLLVAVVLSAQCTDKRVNLVTPALFERFPDPPSMASSTEEEIFSYIKSISYPASKAKHLLGAARILVDSHGGQVPESHEKLMELPGVGRKTANVLTSVLHGAPNMAVDTHVFRVAARIGLTLKAKTPLAAEKQLVSLFETAEIPAAHHYLILHGRYTCTARNPKCGSCSLVEHCAYFKKEQKKAFKATK